MNVMTRFAAVAALSAIASAATEPGQLNEKDTKSYSAAFTAVPRAQEDDGDLLAGYGMTGTYALWKYFHLEGDDAFYFVLTTEIDTTQIKTEQYF